ncbi:efflux transporter outer membrane subunit [Dyella sedimenti]|uniref:efflux transporter outer membrane subunit n=1 Tax=Dyella sedimenti TaxID=2919947 RepID=UPI001FAA3269|nr:efflux transporter outer membrane subunit [Dyella sedimenti]
MNAKTSLRMFKFSISLAALLALAGCSLAPTYSRPSMATPPAYKEATGISNDELLAPGETAGTWQEARPAEATPRGEWWTVFEDSALNDLERQALEANQDLKAAAARVNEARAMTQVARSALFPTLDAGLGPTRQQVSGASQSLPAGQTVPPQTLWRAQGNISYEVDLFGRVASSVKAAKADAARSEAMFRSVQLALQADVATNYFNLRELDAEAAVFQQALKYREEAFALVQRRFDEGDISEVDVARAKAELESARSDAMTVQRQRAASEHALAVLVGKPPADFSMAPKPLESVRLRLPAGLPSTLLERRPDIAAAEDAMQAANQRIGMARAAFFPSLSLTGTGGFESSSLGSLFHWSSRTFLLGPLVGTALNVPVFDGGRRKGDLANAKATYEEDVARYRQQVLVAFREVEDSLSDLRILDDQTRTAAAAVQSSTRAAELLRKQYAEGAVAYLDVLDAERTVLQARRSEVQLAGVQANATVNLIRALGGGWDEAPAADGSTAQASR